jgi:hypothetical protein
MKTNFNINEFTKNELTFLSDIFLNNIFKTGTSHYFKFSTINNIINREDLIQFIEILDINKAYVILPFISTRKLISTNSIITLSDEILLSKISNYKLLENFLNSQISIEIEDLGVEDLDNLQMFLNLKYSEISLDNDT